jgi:hypothetical protein
MKNRVFLRNPIVGQEILVLAKEKTFSRLYKRAKVVEIMEENEDYVKIRYECKNGDVETFSVSKRGDKNFLVAV